MNRYTPNVLILSVVKGFPGFQNVSIEEQRGKFASPNVAATPNNGWSFTVTNCEYDLRKMEHETKRQWMQSYEGRIRVGPQYQAMIPPFCRNNFASSQFNTNQDYSSSPVQYPQSNNRTTPVNHHPLTHSEQYIQSYDSPDDSFNDTDIGRHLKFDEQGSDDKTQRQSNANKK